MPILYTKSLKAQNSLKTGIIPEKQSSTSTEGNRQQTQLKQVEFTKRLDALNLTEEDFKNKYGTTQHRYWYDTDPRYKLKVDSNSKELSKRVGSYEYPSTDVRRDGVINPNAEFMVPNLKGKTKSGMVESTNDIISSVLPIPGIEEIKGTKLFNIENKVFKENKLIEQLNSILKPKVEFDIHDVRLDYHNKNRILSPYEHQMLKKEGYGNSINYKGIHTKDAVGNILKDDVKPNRPKNLQDYLTGKQHEKISEQNTNIKDLTVYKKEENKILPNKKYINPSDNITLPYERSEVSRKADKEISNWYSDQVTKEKFINYGGTDNEFNNVLNSLENPIRSNYEKWGENQPAGAYIPIVDRAGIPKNSTVGIGVHEGAHKTKILLPSNKFKYPKLHNDLIDAVKEAPSETYAEIMRMRSNMKWSPSTKINSDMLEKGLTTIEDGYGIPYKIQDKKLFLDIVNKAPIIIPPAMLTISNQNK